MPRQFAIKRLHEPKPEDYVTVNGVVLLFPNAHTAQELADQLDSEEMGWYDVVELVFSERPSDRPEPPPNVVIREDKDPRTSARRV